MNAPRVEALRQVIAAEQIQKRVKELGRQISDDYQGQTIQALAVLENAFMFMADLVRALDVPVVCQFIKPKYSKQTRQQQGNQAGEITWKSSSATSRISAASIFCWSKAWCIPG
jgi:hypoxanthine-guanine phosphoribosyltransferase